MEQELRHGYHLEAGYLEKRWLARSCQAPYHLLKFHQIHNGEAFEAIEFPFSDSL